MSESKKRKLLDEDKNNAEEKSAKQRGKLVQSKKQDSSGKSETKKPPQLNAHNLESILAQSNWNKLKKVVAKPRKPNKKYQEKKKIAEDLNLKTEESHEEQGESQEIDKKELTEQANIEESANNEESTRPTKRLVVGYELTKEIDKQKFLSRVVILNSFGNVILDTRIQLPESVSKRTVKTRVPTYKEAQKQISDLLKNRIMIGHELNEFLKPLFFSHPRKLTRDTGHTRLFHKEGDTADDYLTLKKLAKRILKETVEDGDAMESAQVVLKLYNSVKKKWEDLANSKVKRVSQMKNEKRIAKSVGHESSDSDE